MSLNWDATKVEGFKDFSDEDYHVLDTLIWMSLATGIREITKENYKELYARIALIEKLFGAMRAEKGRSVYFKIEEIEKCIGLVTNTTTLTRHQFNKNQMARFYKEKGV